MTPQPTPWWEHDEEGLVVVLGERRDAVPAAVAAWLLDPERHGTSGDVAGDVLRLDAELRDIIARLVDKVVEANAEVSEHRRRVADIGRVWFARRRAATTKLNHAFDTHAETAKVLEETRSLLRILREFVIALDPEDGLLAEAAAGWARSPDVPAGVSVFEHGYFLLDTRRSAGPSGLSWQMIGGEEFGELWRRDGDDPVDQPLNRPGCWQVGYIERTREIYAARRSATESREVWLLGRNFEPQRARELLRGLMPRMQEPNSVILVAAAVADAQHEHGEADDGGIPA